MFCSRVHINFVWCCEPCISSSVCRDLNNFFLEWSVSNTDFFSFNGILQLETKKVSFTMVFALCDHWCYVSPYYLDDVAPCLLGNIWDFVTQSVEYCIFL